MSDSFVIDLLSYIHVKISSGCNLFEKQKYQLNCACEVLPSSNEKNFVLISGMCPADLLLRFHELLHGILVMEYDTFVDEVRDAFTSRFLFIHSSLLSVIIGNKPPRRDR